MKKRRTRNDGAINAHIKCHGGEPFTLRRDEAYIGFD